VPIHVPSGCRLRDVAVWRQRVAYVLRPERSCSVHARGLWLRDGRTRRVSRFADRLGDLRDGRLSWFETLYGGSGWRLRLAPLHGRARTVRSGNLDCCLLAGGAIGGGHVHWVESPDTIRATLGRERVADLGGCEYLEPTDAFPWDGTIALDGSTPVYADAFGIFAVDHARWHRC
jgi:hypothetical protein